MLSLLTILFIKHFFLDFVYQPPYQYLNKGNWKHPGGYIHAGNHALMTIFILAIFYVNFFVILVLSFAEFIIHYLMDYTKVNICKKNNYTPTTSENWFWWLGFDQLIHSLTYILIVFFAFTS